MRELIRLLETKDHFELLDELAVLLAKCSDTTIAISRGMDLNKIGRIRETLPEHLVEAYILIEVLKMKFSVMAGEWNEAIDNVSERLIKENKVENRFDEMKF